MAWRNKRNSDHGSDESLGPVEIFTSGGGMIVEGSPTAVSAFVDQMLDATSEVGGRSRHVVVDGVQVAANIAAFRQTHREYIEFSERAVKLLKEHGAIATKDGNFRSFVKKGEEFAGNLDWKPVDLGPEQALSLQAAAGQLALRAAIKEVTVALERIEGKIDKLADLAEAERLGAVVADRATLQPLVDRVRSSGKLSSTDWATVASLGPLIARDVEALRAYILRQLKDVKDSSLVRSRAGEAEELTDRLLKESVALLVVAEQNYALWQELRLAHAVNHEPAATAAVTSDIQQQLAALTQADQRLVDTLQDVVDRLTSPTGYEGLAPLQKRRLRKHVGQLDEMNRWFCEQRHLDDRPNRAARARSNDRIARQGRGHDRGRGPHHDQSHRRQPRVACASAPARMTTPTRRARRSSLLEALGMRYLTRARPSWVSATVSLMWWRRRQRNQPTAPTISATTTYCTLLMMSATVSWWEAAT